MAKISLRKALQVKKNLTGEITKVRTTVMVHNSQRNPNRHINVLELVAEFESKVEKLIAIKTALAVANVSIYEDILRVDELKGLISFYEGLNTEEEGQEFKAVEGFVKFTNTVAIDYSEKESNIKTLKAELEQRLEKIDEFNSTHYIEIAD